MSELDDLRAWYHTVQGSQPGEVLSDLELSERHLFRDAAQDIIGNSEPTTDVGRRAQYARQFRGALAMGTRTYDGAADDELARLRWLHASVEHASQVGSFDWRQPSQAALASWHDALKSIVA